MAGERSQEKHSVGALYVVGLPIGNPDDVTLRALRVLRTVDIVASKDPHHTLRFLSRHRIGALLTTYDRRNAREKTPILLHRLRSGSKVALISDCGTPGLYDPGSLLVAHAHRAAIRVVSVPGPSALAATLAIAGMPGDVFSFYGRFPASEARAMSLLTELKVRRCTSIFFVRPEQLRRILRLIEQGLGNKQVCLAVNLTHPGEQILRGKLTRLLRNYPLRFPGAGVTVVVAGR
ncbi:MAG TPA: SAM-dependent methyltransferase [Nitrospiraceae bacterium]|nr:SAM-dependent methyltransferase [Nitrospiraceae bacterium]